MIHLILASSSEKLNGFWSPWGPWSSCSGTETGQELRQRICIEPQNGGEPCIGTKNTETRHCGPESGMYFLFKNNNFSWCFFKNYFVRISNLASLAKLFHKFRFQYISKNAIIFEQVLMYVLEKGYTIRKIKKWNTKNQIAKIKYFSRHGFYGV